MKTITKADARACGVEIGKIFMHPSLGRCEVVEYKPRASKYPVIVNTNRGRYKISINEYNGATA